MSNLDDVIRVFIGYDSRLAVCYNIAQHSLIRYSSRPLAITPIKLTHLTHLFNRPKLNVQSTEFSFSRFLTPYLAGYQGWAIFMDNDIVARDDIAMLWALRDDRYAVMCVKHDHQPTSTVKFLGEAQTQYDKKNWTSVMLMNTAKCKALTPEYVNTASGLELHQFKWLGDDSLIGEIPMQWNFLAEYYKHDDSAKMIHYTEGGPYYAATRQVDFAEVWFDNFRDGASCLDSDYATLTREAQRSQVSQAAE
jgi:lipopolysaccharide biosynthesis glycosyltransferase